MSYIQVKNRKEGAADQLPNGYSSWLDYWEKKKGRKATKCEALACRETPTVGAHVIKAHMDGKEYIIAICHAHNNKPEDELFYTRKSDLVLVK
nr:hypothetical protein [uncultured Carboxylicivirga sp.]